MPAKPAPAANITAITNSKMAACLLAMGFPWDLEVIHQDKTGQDVVQVLFKPHSVRPEYAGCTPALAAAWQKGELQIKAPMHPFCIMMRGQEIYDAQLTSQRQGEPHRLVSVCGGRMTVYRTGPESPTLVNQPDSACIRTDDYALACALGAAGIPIIRRHGPVGGRVYTLPHFGYLLTREDGSQYLEDARELSRRSPNATAKDPLRLALEDHTPTHPVVLIYEALYARSVLKVQIQKAKPLLVLQGQGSLQALLTMNATGRVMEKTTAHFKSPPIRWK